MDIPQSVYPSVYVLLDYFHFTAIMDNIAMNIHIQVCELVVLLEGVVFLEG